MFVMTPLNPALHRHPCIFSYTIGDRSGDGHSKTHTLFLRVMCLSTDLQQQLDEIKAAYNDAKMQAEKLEPSTYCKAYEDNEIPDDVRSLWAARGQTPPETLYAEDYAALCAAFLNIGQPELRAEICADPTPDLDDVFGYGGYGLFF